MTAAVWPKTPYRPTKPPGTSGSTINLDAGRPQTRCRKVERDQGILSPFVLARVPAQVTDGGDRWGF